MGGAMWKAGLVALAVIATDARAETESQAARPQSLRVTHAERQAVANRMKAARARQARRDAAKTSRPETKRTR